MNELVTLKRDQAVRDSLDVAEKFHKRHDHVIRKIDELIPQNRGVKNMFHQTKYIAENGQEYRKYLMNRDGFSLLVMGFTGKDALEWKLKYIQAFNEMEKVISEKTTSDWISTRKQGMLTRRSETDIIKELVEYAKTQGSEHADMMYVTYTKLANKIAGVKNRDTAAVTQLNNLTLAENIILHCIKNGMIADKHYKVIYQECKERLEMFKDITYLDEIKVIAQQAM